jgi:hypothetical protein
MSVKLVIKLLDQEIIDTCKKNNDNSIKELGNYLFNMLSFLNLFQKYDLQESKRIREYFAEINLTKETGKQIEQTLLNFDEIKKVFPELNIKNIC